MSAAPPPTGRAARERRRHDLARTLGAALERLVERGETFSEVSVDRLVSEASVSRSSFYRHFADKGELLGALAVELVRERDVAGRAIWDVPPTAPRAEVRDAFRVFLDVCWRHRLALRAISEAQGHERTARELHHEITRRAVERVRTHVEAGQAGGWVRPELDPATVAEWIVAMNDRGIAALVGHAEESELDRLSDSLSSVVWFTLYDGLRANT